MAYLHPTVGNLLKTGTTPSAPVASVPAMTAAAAAGPTPTKAEHDALVVDLAATRTTVNNLLVALRAAGYVAP